MTVAAIALPMPKFRMVMFSAVADCHRPVAAHDLDAEPLGEHLDVVGEVGEQDVMTELLERSTGVPRQPVLDDVGFCLHEALRVY